MSASSGERKLRDKVALVSGASRGIGRAIAAAYAREGARVFLCARRQPDLDRAIHEIASAGGKIAGCPGDVGFAEDVQRIVSAATDRFGTIDRSEEHTSELQSRRDLVCRLLLEKKKEQEGE